MLVGLDKPKMKPRLNPTAIAQDRHTALLLPLWEYRQTSLGILRGQKVLFLFEVYIRLVFPCFPSHLRIDYTWSKK